MRPSLSVQLASCLLISLYVCYICAKCAAQHTCTSLCSIEVRRNTGSLLGRAVYHKEEENRGVVRNELVLALADALPKGCLHLSCNLESVTIDANGESSSKLPHSSGDCMAMAEYGVAVYLMSGTKASHLLFIGDWVSR